MSPTAHAVAGARCILAVMIEIASMAGYITAHGIWCVSEGETLIPILAYELPDGERVLQRVQADDLKDAVAVAQHALETNEPGAVRAVLVVDAYVNFEWGRSDALAVEAVEYGLTPWSMELAVPYQPLTDSTAFEVYGPTFFDVAGGLDDVDVAPVADSFFDGAESHSDAWAVWKAHQVV